MAALQEGRGCLDIYFQNAIKILRQLGYGEQEHPELCPAAWFLAPLTNAPEAIGCKNHFFSTAKAAPSSHKHRQGRDSVHHGVRLKLFKERRREAENVCPGKGRKHSRSGLNQKNSLKGSIDTFLHLSCTSIFKTSQQYKITLQWKQQPVSEQG